MPSVDLSYQVQARRRFRVAQRAPRAQQCQGSSQESLLLAVRPGAPSSFLLLLVRHLLLLAMHLLLVAMPFATSINALVPRSVLSAKCFPGGAEQKYLTLSLARLLN